MLRKHFATVSLIDQDRHTSYLVRDYFALSHITPLLPACEQRGLFQADLVCALLVLRDQRTTHATVFTDFIEALMGHPIQIGAPCLSQYRAQSLLTRIVRSKDQRRITAVVPHNPRQPQTTPFFQWREYRVGRTLGELMVRGITRRDIRRALKRQWIRVEEVI